MHYWLKQCPRCHGDFKEESDRFGEYLSCVQCGHIANEKEEQGLRLERAIRDNILAEKAAA